MGGPESSAGARPASATEALNEAFLKEAEAANEVNQTQPAQDPGPSVSERIQRARDPETGKFVRRDAAENSDPVDPEPKAGHGDLTDDTVVTIPGRRGTPISLPFQKVRELASKGHDYETKMRALKEEKESLQADSQRYEDYKEYVNWMRDHPNVAQHVAETLQFFEQTGQLPNATFEEALEDGETPSRPSPSPVYDRRIEQLESRIEGRERAEAEQTLARRLVAAVESNPILERVSRMTAPKGRDIALEKLAALIQSDPSLASDMETAAQAVATEFQMVSETLGGEGYVEEKQRDQRRFASESPRGAPPPVQEAEPQRTYGAADLKNGRVRREAIDLLSRTLGE